MIAGLVLAIAGIWQLFGGQLFANAPLPATETATRGDIQSLVRAVGTVKPIREVEVGTQATGQVRAMKVAVGEYVKQGQLLAEIDPELAENDVREAQAERDRLLASRASHKLLYRLMEKQFRRAALLARSGAGSQADLEQTQADWQRQEAALQENAASLQKANVLLGSAKTRLSQTRLLAPIAGQVMDIKIKQGQTVVAAQTVPIVLVLADTRRMQVQTYISEADIAGVGPGQDVTFNVRAEPEKRMHATLLSVEPTPVKIQGDTDRAIYYTALFEVDNPKGELRSVMTADVTIVRNRASGVLTVPLTALLEQQAQLKDAQRASESEAFGPPYGRRVEQIQILKTSKGKEPVELETRDVTLGIRGDMRVQVLTGLTPGELVVIDPAHESSGPVADLL